MWGNMTLTCSSTSWHLPLETTTNQSQSFASTTVTPSTIIFHPKSKNLLPLVVSFVGLSHHHIAAENEGENWALRLSLVSCGSTRCSRKFWIDSDQKSWILKMFQDSSSAGNPGMHWIIGPKIKSYYQTLPFWWRLSQEKAVLFCKNWKFI